MRSLGRGGMGEVYLARGADGTQRAFKIVRGDRVAGPQALARFRREVMLLDRLKHPGIVQILNTGTLADGGLYLAMEYVDGPDLQTEIDKQGPASVREALKILIQLAEALAFAHGQHVVHRDLKPANVLLSATGPKIIDFGLAKLAADEGLTRLTDDEQVLGSPLYLAPEQSSSSSVGPEADIYALGGLAYFALTGAPLFTPRSAVAMVYAHVHETPESLTVRAPDIELPPGLDALIARCVAKAPAQRPTAGELVVAFAPLLAAAPGSRQSRPKVHVVNEDQEAVQAQIRQIVLELAGILDISTEVCDQIQNELSDLEIELAMLEDAGEDERYQRISAHVTELRRGYKEALQEVMAEVFSRRGEANEDALYGELDALYARSGSR